MTLLLEPTPAADRTRPRRFLVHLEGRSAVEHLGPNWFTPVMGTGIVAVAAASLPVDVRGLLVFARAVWVLDVAVLLLVVGATALHWHRHPDTARGHLDDPVMSHLYGAPAMSLMTVGAGALLVGGPVVGERAALGAAAGLWVAGTLAGLWSAAAVPPRIVRSRVGCDAAVGTWLMPVVPPMVSAATGALLVPHLPAGPWRLGLQLVCTGLFGLALVASAVVIGLVVRVLVRRGPGPAAGIPALWIVLGPLGQSVTAAHNLGVTAPSVFPSHGDGVRAAALAYGVTVWAVALLWLCLVVALTVRAAIAGLPFTLGWWSFTFPVGTVVTGTSGLAAATGLAVLVVTATGLYVVLLGAWAVVAARTVLGVHGGHLLRAPAARVGSPVGAGR